MGVILHSPYSSDLTPCDVEDIQAESPRVLDILPENDFKKVFQKWRRRWDRCLHVGGYYLEDNGGR
jgi:hypothetical protein